MTKYIILILLFSTIGYGYNIHGQVTVKQDSIDFHKADTITGDFPFGRPVLVTVDPYTGRPAYLDSIPLFSETFIGGYSGYGYRPTKQYDTVQAVVLLTVCNKCSAQAQPAFAVREKYVYFGDPMPTFPPTDYSDSWREIKLLDENKRPFLKNVIIWQSKIIE